MQWTQKQLDILRAAAKLFEQTPCKKITTLNLSLQIGTGEAAIYRHFPSKGKILSSLLEFCEISLITEVKEITQAELTPREVIKDILLTYCDFFEANPGLSRMIYSHAMSEDIQDFDERVEGLFSMLPTFFSEQLTLLGSEEALSLLQGEMLTSILEGSIQSWSRNKFANSLSQKVLSLADTVLSLD